jgi:hypothetical protein
MEKSNTIRTFHLLVFIVSMMICLLVTIGYGWLGYAAITGRPGMQGHLYIYYDISPEIFCLYNFLNALFSFGLMFFQLYHLGNDNKKGLVKIFKAVGLFIVYIIIAELCLQSGYVGKG